MKKRVSALTLIGVALMLSSIGIQALTAVYLGAGSDRDALFIALSVPLFLNALSTGSLSFTITPAILGHSGVPAQRQTLTRLLLTTFLAATALAACIHWLRAPLVDALAPGFSDAQHAVTSDLLDCVLPMIPLQAATAVVTGYWVARERVYLSGLALLLGNLITVTLMIGGWQDALHVAQALLCGTLAAALVPLAAYAGESIPVAPAAPFGPARPFNTGSYYAQVGPLLLSGIVGRSTSLVERRLASAFPDGTLSCLSYAGYLVSFLVTATTAPVATANYSQLCQHWNARNLAAIEQFFTGGLRVVTWFSLSIVGYILLFFRDAFILVVPWTNFTEANADEITVYMHILMVAYVGLVYSSFVARIFYISGRFVQASLFDCCGFAVYLLGTVLLTRSLGAPGLATAMSVYALVLSVIFFVSIRRIFGLSFGRRFWFDVGSWVAVWLLAIAAGWLVKLTVAGWTGLLLAAVAYTSILVWNVLSRLPAKAPAPISEPQLPTA